MLVQSLKELEAVGIVHREQYNIGVPFCDTCDKRNSKDIAGYITTGKEIAIVWQTMAISLNL